MDQEKIWGYFQNNNNIDDVFAQAMPRYEFISRRVERNSNVLNIGVGRGGLEEVLLNRRAIVSCLDPNEESIARLREKYVLGDRAQVGFSQKIPFRDNSFDVVIMTEVLEHLTDDALTESLHEIRRILKPNGRFIGTVPANELLIDAQVICPYCGESFHRWGHLQSFSQTRLNNSFKNAKLIVLRNEVRAFVAWRSKGIVGFLKSTIRYILGRMGEPIANPSIYFEAKPQK